MLVDQFNGLAYKSRADTQRTSLLLSAGCLPLTGYPPEALLDPAHTGYMDLIHPADRTTATAAIAQAIANRSNYQLIYRLHTAQGQEKWVLDDGRCLYTPDGQPLFLQGFISDITERKQVELALQELAATTVLPDSKAFLRQCVERLAKVYAASHVFIGLFADEAHTRIRTHAVWVEGRQADNFVYELAGTPCEDILGRSIELIPRDAAKLYPQDKALAQMGIEAYYGSPLVNSRQEIIGIVTVLNTKPMQPNLWTRPVLGIFASRIALELERQQTRREFSNLYNNANEGIYRSLPDGRLLRVNPALVRFNGYASEQELLVAVRDTAAEWYVEPGRRDEFKRLLELHGRIENFVSEVYRHRTRERIWISENAYAVRDDAGQMLYYEGTVLDISARKRAEDALRASESRFRAFIDNASDIVLLLDAAGRLDYISPAVERVLGVTAVQMLGRRVFAAVHPADRTRVRAEFARLRAGASRSHGLELRIRHRDGTWHVIEAIGSNCLADPALCGIVVNARDVTERYEAEQHIQHLARHDGLTGLPNRTQFGQCCREALLRAAHQGHQLSLLFIDLDRFKAINDSLGHAVGDQLLQAVAECLRKSVRQSDTVARLGGDEFAVLVEAIAEPLHAALIAQKLLDVLSQPFLLAGQPIFISASIGISCYPRDGQDMPTLVKNADVALYRAKAESRNGYRFFSAGMNAKALDDLLLANEMRLALERHEFVLYYQPRIDLRTEQIVGAEALIRWQHPRRGLLTPQTFIGLAEDTGLIDALGEWVLRTACRQVQHWRTRYPITPLLAVNLSPRQFNRDDFIERIRTILHESGLEQGGIECEITETIMMQDPQRTRQILSDLKALQIPVAIDDFGIGYSSLSYLKQFQIDMLKIDASFVSGIPDDSDDVAITSAIIALAHSLNIHLIAEGVETKAQQQFLLAHGCQEAQGYLFSRPVPLADMEALLDAEHRNRSGVNQP